MNRRDDKETENEGWWYSRGDSHVHSLVVADRSVQEAIPRNSQTTTLQEISSALTPCLKGKKCKTHIHTGVIP